MTSDTALKAGDACLLTLACIVCSTAEVLVHPSLEGRPILILANKSDECESISTDLSHTIKAWFAEKLAHIDDDPDHNTSHSDGHSAKKQNGNIFADDDDDAYRPPPAAAGSMLSEKDYEWDVLLTSALEG